MSDCVIIGIGNILKTDDGIGVHAVRYLRDRLPGGVLLVEGGTYSPDLLPCLEKRRRAIFIDGVDARDEPGVIFRFSPRELARRLPSVPLSLHDFGLYDLITAADLLDLRPADITIIAVQVKSLETGTELSPELEEALPRIHRLIVEELDG